MKITCFRRSIFKTAIFLLLEFFILIISRQLLFKDSNLDDNQYHSNQGDFLQLKVDNYLPVITLNSKTIPLKELNMHKKLLFQFINNRISKKYNHCPYCGGKLKNVCSKCGQVLQYGWFFCSGCGEKVNAAVFDES